LSKKQTVARKSIYSYAVT